MSKELTIAIYNGHERKWQIRHGFGDANNAGQVALVASLPEPKYVTGSEVVFYRESMGAPQKARIEIIQWFFFGYAPHAGLRYCVCVNGHATHIKEESITKCLAVGDGGFMGFDRYYAE